MVDVQIYALDTICQFFKPNAYRLLYDSLTFPIVDFGWISTTKLGRKFRYE